MFKGRLSTIFPLSIHPRARDRPDEDVERKALVPANWDIELHRELLKLAKLVSVWEEKGARDMAAEQVMLAIMKRCSLVPQDLRQLKRE